MICYHDKTWCSFHNECTHGKECSSALTNKVKEDAVKWWGSSDAPVMEFSSKPECFKLKEDGRK